MIIKNKLSGRNIYPVIFRYLNKIAVIAVLLFAVVFNPGCKKDDGPAGPKGEYYIKFKADGKQRVIDYATIQGAPSEVDSSLVVGGKKIYVYSFGAANANAESIGIAVSSLTRLTAPRTFKESVVVQTTSPEATILYGTDAQSLLNGQAYTSVGFFAPNPVLFPEYSSLPRDLTVTVSEYNDVYISGTFSGTVYQQDGMGNALTSIKKALTEGEFKIKLP